MQSTPRTRNFNLIRLRLFTTDLRFRRIRMLSFVWLLLARLITVYSLEKAKIIRSSMDREIEWSLNKYTMFLFNHQASGRDLHGGSRSSFRSYFVNFYNGLMRNIGNAGRLSNL